MVYDMKQNLEDFEIVKTDPESMRELGGFYGDADKVYLTRSASHLSQNSDYFAVRTIRKQDIVGHGKITQSNLSGIVVEYEIMRTCKSQFLLSVNHLFMTRSSLHFVMPFYKFSLDQLIKKKGKLLES